MIALSGLDRNVRAANKRGSPSPSLLLNETTFADATSLIDITQWSAYALTIYLLVSDRHRNSAQAVAPTSFCHVCEVESEIAISAIDNYAMRNSLSRSSTSSTISSSSMLIELPIDKIILDEPVKRDVSVPGSNLSIPSFTAPIKALLTRQLAVLPRRLRIVGLLATRDNGCHQYAKLTAKNCIANGIVFEMRDISSCRDLEEYAAYGETKRAIFEINEDHGVDGLIVYFPLFGPQKVCPPKNQRSTA